ncbi:MAG: RNA polymerase sigma-70 factor [Agriterribacter sp.]
MISYSDENDIVKLFRQQDAAATRKLYDWFYRPLCYYADKIVQSRQEAEDIVVEVFIKLFQKRADFYKLSEIKSFLYTATRNAAIDFYRKQKRHERSKNEISYLAEQTVSQESELVNVEVLAMLYREIESLPAQCSIIFKLLFFQRLTPAQAAAELNISTKTVLNQKGKAIQLLRKSFLEKGMLSLLAMVTIGL